MLRKIGMRKLALIGIVGIFCLVVLSAMSKDEAFGAERFYLGIHMDGVFITHGEEICGA